MVHRQLTAQQLSLIGGHWMTLKGRVQPVNVRSNLGWILKSPEQVQSFTYHICALRLIRWVLKLGRTCSGPGLHSWTWMDLRRKWTHITNHSGWSKSSHGGMVSWFQLDTVNYIFRCCALNIWVVLGVSHCMEQQNLLIIGQSQRVGSLNSSRLISSYKVIWKSGWPVTCKQMRGGRCRIFLLFQWQESIPKNC